MKNRMSDVRNHLVAMLEELGDKDADEMTVKRAQAMNGVATAFISSVKCEIDARRLAGMEDELPEALGAPEPVAGQVRRLASV